MGEAKIVSIEWATLEGTRPRSAGCNARLGVHGQTVCEPLARITTDDCAQGFGASTAKVTDASALLGCTLTELWDHEQGTTQTGRALDFALWDLMAKRANKPVYALAAEMASAVVLEPLRTPCYDTSLYMDDLHLEDDDEAAALIADEARFGLAQGHRAFKIKVGRGARHMAQDAGLRRDVAVVRAVRDVAGNDAPIMLDANNGYNLNLTQQVLAETADSDILWMEEPFHEDSVLYIELHEWMAARGLETLIADGEGDASPRLLAWAQDGIVDVVQYDIISYGFTPWLALGRKLDTWNARSAPHNYGRYYGNYASCHLSAAVRGFTFTEWDEAITPGLDPSAYTIDDGEVTVPALPGFGLALEEDVFEQAVRENGYTLTWT
jgi:L-rhamnonate dehydratase